MKLNNLLFLVSLSINFFNNIYSFNAPEAYANCNEILSDIIDISCNYKKIKAFHNIKDRICPQGMIFNEHLYLNLNETCIISALTFRELIDSQKVFVLAVSKTKSGLYNFFNATELNKYYNSKDYSIHIKALNLSASKKGKKIIINPITREKLKKIEYYFFNPFTKNFEYIGNQENLWTNRSPNLTNLILASFIDAPRNNSSMLLLGLHYEFEDQLELSEYFYNQASESPEKYYCLYQCYSNMYYQIKTKAKTAENAEIARKIKELKDNYYVQALKPENFKKLEEFAIALLTKANGKFHFGGNSTKMALKLIIDLKTHGYEKVESYLHIIGHVETKGKARKKLDFE